MIDFLIYSAIVIGALVVGIVLLNALVMWAASKQIKRNHD